MIHLRTTNAGIVLADYWKGETACLAERRRRAPMHPIPLIRKVCRCRCGALASAIASRRAHSIVRREVAPISTAEFVRRTGRAWEDLDR